MKLWALAGVLAAIAAASSPARAVPPPRWAVAVLPSGHEFTLEVAADDSSRARGYMGRESVGPREGMLFVFEQDGRHAFWMKDCKTSLDIVWLDASLRVVWIAPRQAPCPAAGDCPQIAPPSAARFVLEFAAGTAASESLGPGDAVVVLSEPPLR
jgi:hypothetical protein